MSNDTQDNSEMVILLTRIDTRLGAVEDTVENINTRLFTGNGDALVTRLRLAEENISTVLQQSNDTRRSKVAVFVALVTGFVSMITSITVAFVGK